MMVDDWDSSNVVVADEESKKGLDTKDQQTIVSEDEVSLRDEFSYSLLDAIWMRR